MSQWISAIVVWKESKFKSRTQDQHLRIDYSTINLLGISVITKMPRRTWEERKDSKDEQTKSLGRLSTHVTSEDEQGKKEKQQSKTKQEKGKSNGLPWDLIKGFWGIIKSRIVTSTPTTIIFIIVISWKSAVLNIAPRRHICKRSARQTLQAFNLKSHKQTNFNYDVIIILQKVLSFFFPSSSNTLINKMREKKIELLHLS